MHEVGWAYSRHIVHSAAALADCRLVLVGLFLTLSAQIETTPTISGIVGNFRSGGALADQRALIIENSLMSECG